MRDSRVAKLRGLMAERKLDAFLVTSIPNVFYLAGFTGSTAAAVVTPAKCFILVDPRYTVQARAECAGCRVVEYVGKSTIAAAAEQINELGVARVGFEADDLTVSIFRQLRAKTAKSVSFRRSNGRIETLRLVKDADEIDLIRKAAEIADRAFKTVIKQIAVGMLEKEIALLVDTTLRQLGADKEAFDTIAASGPNAACPHASPTDRAIQRGDLLKMDFGARYRGYNSDITRTVCFGEPDAKQREVYDIVLEAQLKAIEAIAPGRSGKEIDAMARDFIASKGYGDNFGHGLGHSLGILVHDGPGFSRTSDIVLEPGMVMTVEPGIYIEDWGGVRIEDDVLVTDTGVEVLTHARKGLTSL